MNKIISLISVSVIALIVSSCSDHEIPGVEQSSEQDALLVSETSAIRNAQSMLSVIGKNETRSAKPAVSVKRFRQSQSGTRGGAEDTGSRGFYIINYGTDEGFAIVSADKRDARVYAISDAGHLSLSDTLDNPGLNWYVNSAMTDMSNRYVDMPLDSMSTLAPLPWHYEKTYSEPMLKGFMAKFHQHFPYNKYCNSGAPLYEQRLVGCGPLAMGTIVGYYKWPAAAEGYTFDWNGMYSYLYHDGWSRLFEMLGRPKYLNSDYSIPTATSTFTSRFIPSFQEIGYVSQKLERFSTTKVAVELSSGNPVLCIGYSLLADGTNYGHAWVIDGGYVVGEEEIAVVKGEEKKKVYYDYFNCIWGWGGNNNGYFLYEPGSNTLDSFKDLSIVYGFRPNRK